ncbi:MAG: hypothetical protein IJK62_15170 [Bacteroidales bacterium]|nr:hypothetical protein [Bacteroidales bacterium]
MLRKIWDAFKNWASVALNWLKNFISKVWDFIKNWFSKLFDYVKDLLENEDDEAVIIDTQTEVGRDIYEQICKNCPETTPINKYDKNGKMVLGFDGEHNIKKVENFQAKKVEDNDTDFDRNLAEKGLIRMTM